MGLQGRQQQQVLGNKRVDSSTKYQKTSSGTPATDSHLDASNSREASNRNDVGNSGNVSNNDDASNSSEGQQEQGCQEQYIVCKYTK